MAWDKSKPAGTEQVRTGDEYIREFKRDVQDAAQVEHIFPVNTGDPKAHHSFGYGDTASKPAAAFAGRLYFNTDTGILEYDDGDGGSPAWHDLTASRDIIPSGTVMAFVEASAPTGWTKITTHDDKMLRVVNSTGGGSAGSWTVPIDASVDHTHVISKLITATHSFSVFLFKSGGGNAIGVVADHSWTHTHALTSTGAHTHTPENTWRPQYVDVILCSKD